MQTLLTIARADWGPAFRAAAGRIAYAIACAIVAAEIAYRAGLATGRAVHWLSDHLAGLASGRIDRAETARAVVAWAQTILAAPESAPAPVAVVITAEPTEPTPSLAETFAAGASIARMRATLDAAEAAETVAPPVVTMACTAAAPATPEAGIASPPIESLTVAQLRAMARARGIVGMGRARRSDLIAALM